MPSISWHFVRKFCTQHKTRNQHKTWQSAFYSEFFETENTQTHNTQHTHTHTHNEEKTKTANRASIFNMSKINKSRLERDWNQQGIDCWRRWVVLTAVVLPFDRIDNIEKNKKPQRQIFLSYGL